VSGGVVIRRSAAISVVSAHQSTPAFEVASLDARRRGGLDRVANRNVVGDFDGDDPRALPGSWLGSSGVHRGTPADGGDVCRSFSNGDEAKARGHTAAQRIHLLAPVVTANTSTSIGVASAVRWLPGKGWRVSLPVWTHVPGSVLLGPCRMGRIVGGVR